EARQRIAKHPVALFDATAIARGDMMHMPVLAGLELDTNAGVIGRNAQLELGKGEALQQFMATVAQGGLEQQAAALVYPELVRITILVTRLQDNRLGFETGHACRLAAGNAVVLLEAMQGNRKNRRKAASFGTLLDEDSA